MQIVLAKKSPILSSILWNEDSNARPLGCETSTLPPVWKVCGNFEILAIFKYLAVYFVYFRQFFPTFTNIPVLLLSWRVKQLTSVPLDMGLSVYCKVLPEGQGDTLG